MSDAFEKSSIFRRYKATHGVPDPFADSTQATIAFDEVLTPLGLRAPMREPNESEAAHLARLGEHAAVFGPEERKRVDRYSLPSDVLAQFVRDDLEIARAEIDRPRFSLKPGELREVIKKDRSGREIHEFYSDEQTGVGPWFSQFKQPMVKHVSGGSKGINTEGSNEYHFNKSETVPELVALRKIQAYTDSAEYRIVKAYADVGKAPPDEVLAKLRKA
jgi:hypothetical protein